MDPQRGVCIGCYRTLDEIARWADMSDMERDRVLSVLPERRTRQIDNGSTSEEPAR
jgi:predicted Fe-S protein YdhL (DUF1289 family)